VAELELKLLGALNVLGNGSTHFQQVSMMTDVSEEVHRCFFLCWLGNMSSIQGEYVYYPRTDEEFNFVVDKYAQIGFPGCTGSINWVHIG
jgi:hypothetical protein